MLRTLDVCFVSLIRAVHTEPAHAVETEEEGAPTAPALSEEEEQCPDVVVELCNIISNRDRESAREV